LGEYDRSSKWLIQHHGDSLLTLAGFGPIVSWKALQAELVQPGQLPDGLIEALLSGENASRLIVFEIATYPESRALRQLIRDALLVYLDRDVLPDVIAVVLCPKGQVRIDPEVLVESATGRSALQLKWTVVELWNVPAESLLATNDPGLMPWVPLCQTAKAPEDILRECREIIDREAPSGERETLLVVTQVLTSLRYNDPDLLQILGGRDAMIESPLLNELRQEFSAEGRAEGRAEARGTSIIEVLAHRFGPGEPQVEQAIQAVRSEERLDDLFHYALRCDSLDDFKRFLEE
jgi:hypothetical protein